MFYTPPRFPGQKKQVGRYLRRLWEIEVFDGDPNDPDVSIIEGTVVAWNAVDAIRLGGDVVKQPVPICWVTWPVDDKDDRIYKIFDTSGPTDELVAPTLGMTAYIGQAPLYTDGTKAKVETFEGGGYKALLAAAQEAEAG